jgi:hypothetical protein
MLELVRFYDIFPQFLKYLSVFGEKSFAKDEGFGGYEAITQYGDNAMSQVFECCFLWKYVELGEASGRFPHTIRHALVYQKFYVNSSQSVNIIVRAPIKIAAEVKVALMSKKGGHHPNLREWPGLQMIFAASGLEEWRSFINYLDYEAAKLDDYLVLNSDTAMMDQLSHRTTHMKQVQFFIDQMLRAGHMLNLNKTTMTAMQRAFIRRKDMIANIPELEDRLENLQQQHEYLLQMVRNVHERATTLLYKVRDTTVLRNHEINRCATHALMDLSRKSAYEARVAKLLTVVAVIFLPATFAADFLQMGYVSVSTRKHFHILATSDLWLFAILALPLLVVTISMYFFFETLSRRQARRHDVSSNHEGVGSFKLV